MEQHSLGYIEVTNRPLWGNDNALHVWSRLENDAFVLGLPCTDGTITLGVYAKQSVIASFKGDHDALLASLFPEINAIHQNDRSAKFTPTEV